MYQKGAESHAVFIQLYEIPVLDSITYGADILRIFEPGNRFSFL